MKWCDRFLPEGLLSTLKIAPHSICCIYCWNSTAFVVNSHFQEDKRLQREQTFAKFNPQWTSAQLCAWIANMGFANEVKPAYVHACDVQAPVHGRSSLPMYTPENACACTCTCHDLTPDVTLQLNGAQENRLLFFWCMYTLFHKQTTNHVMFCHNNTQASVFAQHDLDAGDIFVLEPDDLDEMGASNVDLV